MPNIGTLRMMKLPPAPVCSNCGAAATLAIVYRDPQAMCVPDYYMLPSGKPVPMPLAQANACRNCAVRVAEQVLVNGELTAYRMNTVPKKEEKPEQQTGEPNNAEKESE